MVSNIVVLSRYNISRLENFILSEGKERFSQDDLKLSRELKKKMSLGFCVRLQLLFTFDEQKIAKKISDLVKKILPHLPRNPGLEIGEGVPTLPFSQINTLAPIDGKFLVKFHPDKAPIMAFSTQEVGFFILGLQQNAKIAPNSLVLVNDTPFDVSTPFQRVIR